MCSRIAACVHTDTVVSLRAYTRIQSYRCVRTHGYMTRQLLVEIATTFSLPKFNTGLVLPCNICSLTSLNSCQHDDINIGTVSVARRRWSAPLKPRRPCVKHFITFYALVRLTQGPLFYTQGPLFCALGPLFCALVREKAIFAVCKRCANEGFACMCKEKSFFSRFHQKSWGRQGSYHYYI